jgi:hypothetical protein
VGGHSFASMQGSGDAACLLCMLGAVHFHTMRGLALLNSDWRMSWSSDSASHPTSTLQSLRCILLCTLRRLFNRPCTSTCTSRSTTHKMVIHQCIATAVLGCCCGEGKPCRSSASQHGCISHVEAFQPSPARLTTLHVKNHAWTACLLPPEATPLQHSSKNSAI